MKASSRDLGSLSYMFLKEITRESESDEGREFQPLPPWKNEYCQLALFALYAHAACHMQIIEMSSKMQGGN